MAKIIVSDEIISERENLLLRFRKIIRKRVKDITTRDKSTEEQKISIRNLISDVCNDFIFEEKIDVKNVDQFISIFHEAMDLEGLQVDVNWRKLDDFIAEELKRVERGLSSFYKESFQRPPNPILKKLEELKKEHKNNIPMNIVYQQFPEFSQEELDNKLEKLKRSGDVAELNRGFLLVL